MLKGEVLRRIVSILDRYVTSINGNVKYGDFPFIAYYNGQMRIFNMMKPMSSLLGWLLPVGIPFMVSTAGRSDMGRGVEDVSNKNRAATIAYAIGNNLYVQESLFKAIIKDADAKKLFTPIHDGVVMLVQGGWTAEEQLSYSKFLWQFATTALAGTFREVAQINFDAPMDIDRDILLRDGWVVNNVIGRNAFYGIVTCGVDDRAGMTLRKGKYSWYNKYMTILDITGGNGLQTFGILWKGSSVHPHVGVEGNLCRGNAVRMIQDKINSGMMTEFFIFMKDFLCSYYDGNPFFHLPVGKNGDGSSPIKGSKYLLSKIQHSGRD